MVPTRSDEGVLAWLQYLLYGYHTRHDNEWEGYEQRDRCGILWLGLNLKAPTPSIQSKRQSRRSPSSFRVRVPTHSIQVLTPLLSSPLPSSPLLSSPLLSSPLPSSPLPSPSPEQVPTRSILASNLIPQLCSNQFDTSTTPSPRNPAHSPSLLSTRLWKPNY